MVKEGDDGLGRARPGNAGQERDGQLARPVHPQAVFFQGRNPGAGESHA